MDVESKLKRLLEEMIEEIRDGPPSRDRLQSIIQHYDYLTDQWAWQQIKAAKFLPGKDQDDKKGA